MSGPVVVTGGAGMLGQTLARRLAADGTPVRTVDVRRGDELPAAVHQVVGDVRDPAVVEAAVRGASAVVHCVAALPSYPAEQIRAVTVGGTRAVARAVREAEVPRMVHVSSTAVYGLPDVVPTPEDHPLRPTDAYGRAKVEAEEVCEDLRARGVCVPVLRPKTFLGPGRMGLFSMLFEWAEDGRNFPVLGSGDVRIQMFAVDDLVDAVLAAVRLPAAAAGGTVNVGATEFGTLREDFQAVLDAAGHGKRVVSLPVWPTLPALRLLERTGMSPVYGRLLHKLLADSYVSTDLARQRLGFAPRLSNRDAILRTYDWWRAHRPAAARATGGRTSREPWKQKALAPVKFLF